MKVGDLVKIQLYSKSTFNNGVGIIVADRSIQVNNLPFEVLFIQKENIHYNRAICFCKKELIPLKSINKKLLKVLYDF